MKRKDILATLLLCATAAIVLGAEGDKKPPSTVPASEFEGPHEEFVPRPVSPRKEYVKELTHPITVQTDGVEYGTIAPRPKDFLLQHVVVRPAGGDEPLAVGQADLTYSNTTGIALFPPGAGVLIADDIRTIASGSCDLLSYEMLVGGGGDGTGPGFSVQTALYDFCPSQGGEVIAGSQVDTVLPNDGMFLVTVDLTGLGVQIPTSFWISAVFSTSSAGWVAGAPPEIGFSEDRYHFPAFPCNAMFGGGLHASFHTIVRATNCALLEATQVNVDAGGFNIAGDAANEPSIAVDPTNTDRIAIGWREFNDVNSSFRQAGWAFSEDGGQSWTFPGEIQSGLFRSDPVLDSDADGNFYYNSLEGNFLTTVFKSANGGQTWDAGAFAFGGDKQWMAIDRTNGPGRGHIYQAWSLAAGCCGLATFNLSTDGGVTFSEPIQIPEVPRWGTLSVGPDGALYVGGVGISGPIMVTKSSNAQIAEAVPEFEQTSFVDLGGVPGIGGDPNPAGLSGQVWVATDHSGGDTHGNVYLLSSVDPAGADPMDVMFSRSEDGGATWSAPVRVNDDPIGTNAWQWFGTMSVAPNGRIDAIWNDTRNTGQANLNELYYASSTDGGVTWSQNRSLTIVFDSHVGWPQQNKLGDYYDMVSFDGFAYLAYAATFNGEQDVYFMRVDVDCNGNGIADTVDVADETSPDCNGNLIPDECEADCNDSGAPDDCDIAKGISPDCNTNNSPDECDIAAGSSDDDDRNGIPDECELIIADPPLAEVLANSAPCTQDADCPNESTCIGGVCYVPKNRYLCVRANPANAGLVTARRVSLETNPGAVVLGWVGAPEAGGVSRLASEPFYTNWSAGDGIARVSDCAVAPDHVYLIQALTQGNDPSDEAGYSPSLTLPTTAKWGDVIGSFQNGAWTPPNGIGNLNDAFAAVQAFQGAPTQPPLSWVDVDGAVTNGVVNLADAQLIVTGGFQGNPYPFADPLDCP